MLKQLYIRNFAVIEDVEIAFGEGMTALTGETGAGKSILLDALGLALGGRAEASFLRAGCERGEVSAIFSAPADGELRRLLGEQSIAMENGELLLRRVIGRTSVPAPTSTPSRRRPSCCGRWESFSSMCMGNRPTSPC